MPRKNSKKSLKKKSLKKTSNSLEFNVNLENNPNGLVNPIVKAANDEDKLGKLLNGMTQNSFNDGVDTTIHNTAMLLNTQLEQVLGENPGMFNQNTLEKMLRYVIEPTFNQLNEMSNNTNYNYNQFGGVVGQKQFNGNLKRGEQKGGFYTMSRVRSPMFMPRMRQTIIPRVGYNPRLIMPRTMIVPSYTIITHERVKDLQDRRARDKFNTYLSHYHSFETDDRKTIKIRDYPPGGGISNDTEIDKNNGNSRITRLGDNFYKVVVGGNEVIVNGFNLYYADNQYRKDTWSYGAYRQLLEHISARALYKSKHKACGLKYINNSKVVGITNYIDQDQSGQNNNKRGRKCDDAAANGCSPIQSISHGYFKSAGVNWDRHVMMLENVIE